MSGVSEQQGDPNSEVAVKIQCAWRQKLARKEVGRRKRDKLVKFNEEVEQELENASAQVIQARARKKYGFKSSERPPSPPPKFTEESDTANDGDLEDDENKKDDAFATKIQCAYRQRLARKTVEKRKEDRKVKFAVTIEHELEEASARTIQARAREKYGKKKNSESPVPRADSIDSRATPASRGLTPPTKNLLRSRTSSKSSMTSSQGGLLSATNTKSVADFFTSQSMAGLREAFAFASNASFTENTLSSLLSHRTASQVIPDPEVLLSASEEEAFTLIQEISAIVLQSFARQIFAKKRAKEMKIEEEEVLYNSTANAKAVTIQCAYRQRLARKTVSERKEERKVKFAVETEHELEEASARTIQARARQKYGKNGSSNPPSRTSSCVNKKTSPQSTVLSVSAGLGTSTATTDTTESTGATSSSTTTAPLEGLVSGLHVVTSLSSVGIGEPGRSGSTSASAFTSPSAAQLREAFALASITSESTVATLLSCRHTTQHIVKDLAKLPSSEEDADDLLEEIAAIVLQSFARRIFAKNCVAELKKEHAAEEAAAMNKQLSHTLAADEEPAPPADASPWVKVAADEISPQRQIPDSTERPTTVVYAFRSKSRGYGLTTVFGVAMLEAMSTRADLVTRAHSFIGLQCLHGAAMEKKEEDPLWLPRLERTKWTIGGSTVRDMMRVGPAALQGAISPALRGAGGARAGVRRGLGGGGGGLLSSAKISTSLQYQHEQLNGDNSLLRATSPDGSELHAPATLGPVIALPPSHYPENGPKVYGNGRISKMNTNEVEDLVVESRKELLHLAKRAKNRSRVVGEMKMVKSDTSSGVVPSAHLETTTYKRRSQLGGGGTIHYRGTLKPETIRTLEENEKHANRGHSSLLGSTSTTPANQIAPSDSSVSGAQTLPPLIVHRHPLGMTTAATQQKQKVLDDLLAQGRESPSANAQVSPVPFGGSQKKKGGGGGGGNKSKRVMGRVLGGPKGIHVKPFVSSSDPRKTFTEEEQDALKGHYLKNIVKHFDTKAKIKLGAGGPVPSTFGAGRRF